MPAAPWSVPSLPFSSPRRPNSDQTSVSTRSARPRASRSRWNASSVRAVRSSPSASACGWSECVSYSPGAVSATQRSGSFAASIAASAGELAREAAVVVRVGHRAAEAVVGVLGERRELPAQAVGLRRPSRPGSGTGRARCAPSRPSVASIRSSTSPQTPRRPERVLVGRGQRGDRHLRRGQRGLQLVVEREPLQRVVVRAVVVEVAAHPAARQARVGRADLPEVARGEVRLVGVRVADRRA